MSKYVILISKCCVTYLYFEPLSRREKLLLSVIRRPTQNWMTWSAVASWRGAPLKSTSGWLKRSCRRETWRPIQREQRSHSYQETTTTTTAFCWINQKRKKMLLHDKNMCRDNFATSEKTLHNTSDSAYKLRLLNWRLKHNNRLIIVHRLSLLSDRHKHANKSEGQTSSFEPHRIWDFKRQILKKQNKQQRREKMGGGNVFGIQCAPSSSSSLPWLVCTL